MNIFGSILFGLILICSSNGFNDQKFATDLYTQIKDETSNVIFSPMSVQSALSLLMFGASGETKQEIKDAMHYNNSNDELIQSKYETLSATIKASSNFKIANKIYIAHGHSVKPRFNEIATKSFNSEAQTVKFSDSQKSADIINKWVEDQTNNKIKEFVLASALSDNSKMMLVNAIYFKGEWNKQFNSQLTKKASFFTSESNTVEVDMMTKTNVKL